MKIDKKRAIKKEIKTNSWRKKVERKAYKAYCQWFEEVIGLDAGVTADEYLVHLQTIQTM